MVMGNDEVKRAVAESYRDQYIPAVTICARCLYNLRGLPYEGQCPECGYRYNAVPLFMEGIVVLSRTRPPIGVFVAAVAFGVCTLWSVVAVLNAFTPGLLLVTLMLGTGTVHFIQLTRRRLKNHLVYRRVAARLGSDDFDG